MGGVWNSAAPATQNTFHIPRLLQGQQTRLGSCCETSVGFYNSAGMTFQLFRAAPALMEGGALLLLPQSGICTGDGVSWFYWLELAGICCEQSSPPCWELCRQGRLICSAEAAEVSNSLSAGCSRGSPLLCHILLGAESCWLPVLLSQLPSSQQESLCTLGTSFCLSLYLQPKQLIVS